MISKEDSRLYFKNAFPFVLINFSYSLPYKSANNLNSAQERNKPEFFQQATIQFFCYVLSQKHYNKLCIQYSSGNNYTYMVGYDFQNLCVAVFSEFLKISFPLTGQLIGVFLLFSLFPSLFWTISFIFKVKSFLLFKSSFSTEDF